MGEFTKTQAKSGNAKVGSSQQQTAQQSTVQTPVQIAPGKEELQKQQEAEKSLKSLKEEMNKLDFSTDQGNLEPPLSGKDNKPIPRELTDSRLNLLRDDLLKNWAPKVQGQAPVQTGDSPGKAVRNLPDWVRLFQNKLVILAPTPSQQKKSSKALGSTTVWDENATYAQRLLEIYYRAYIRDELQMPVPGNAGELLARIGESKANDRANLLGESQGAVQNNWCAQASNVSAVLALMKHKLRFRVSNPEGPIGDNKSPYFGLERKDNIIRVPKEKLDKSTPEEALRLKVLALQAELGVQASYMVNNWYMQKDRDKKHQATNPSDPNWRGTLSPKAVGGLPLEPGDIITIVNGGMAGPLSGHVATVIKETNIRTISLPKPIEPAAADENKDHKDSEDQTKDVSAKPETINVPALPIDPKNPPAPGTVLSTLVIVSGNAMSNAVRVEQVERELPPDYDYGDVAGTGNAYLRFKAASDSALKKRDKKYLGKLLTFYLSKGKKPEANKRPNGDFFNKHWSDPVVMNAQFETEGGIYLGLLEEMNNSPENKEYMEKLKDLNNYTKGKTDEKKVYSKDTKEFNKLNIDENKGGRFAPVQEGHSWVVGVNKVSKLDPSKIEGKIERAKSDNEQLKDVIKDDTLGIISLFKSYGVDFASKVQKDEDIESKILAENNLTRMKESIEDIWPGALAALEPTN